MIAPTSALNQQLPYDDEQLQCTFSKRHSLSPLPQTVLTGPQSSAAFIGGTAGRSSNDRSQLSQDLMVLSPDSGGI